MPFSSPGDLPDPGMEPMCPVSPALQTDSLPLSHWGKNQKPTEKDFPGDPVVGNSASSAGDACSIPGQETKIPRAVGQLGSSTTTREPVLTLEKPMHHNERSHVLQLRPDAAK